MGKLREELEQSSYHFFASSNERERIKSVLADLSKTSSDFGHITARALEQLSTAIMPRLRCPSQLSMCCTFHLIPVSMGHQLSMIKTATPQCIIMHNSM